MEQATLVRIIYFILSVAYWREWRRTKKKNGKSQTLQSSIELRR